MSCQCCVPTSHQVSRRTIRGTARGARAPRRMTLREKEPCDWVLATSTYFIPPSGHGAVWSERGTELLLCPQVPLLWKSFPIVAFSLLVCRLRDGRILGGQSMDELRRAQSDRVDGHDSEWPVTELLGNSPAMIKVRELIS